MAAHTAKSFHPPETACRSGVYLGALRPLEFCIGGWGMNPKEDEVKGEALPHPAPREVNNTHDHFEEKPGNDGPTKTRQDYAWRCVVHVRTGGGVQINLAPHEYGNVESQDAQQHDCEVQNMEGEEGMCG